MTPVAPIIDSHCHLDFPAFDSDRAAVIQQATVAGVEAIVVPGVARRAWDHQIGICAEYPMLHYALGLHPLFLDQHGTEDIAALQSRVERHPPVAIGEIGLDYFVKSLDRARQRTLFIEQLGMAERFGLPVILHVRKAHDEVLGMLRDFELPGGIAHAFNGSLDQARRYIDLGFKLGFGGMLTYTRSNKLRALAQALPLEALVLETDAPDMTVSRHRGERNSPAYLPDCLAALAELRPESLHTIAAATTANSKQIYRI